MNDRDKNASEGTNHTSRQPAPRSDSRARRWDPFAMFNELESEMDRMLGSRFPFMQPLIRGVGRVGRAGHEWAPSADIYEKGGNLIVMAELPGVDRNDISVTVESGDLVIQGERQTDEEVRDEDYYRMERFSGTFYRRFAMPEGIEEDSISAEFRDGVLEVTVPKPSGDRQRPERKTIPIR